MYAYPWDVGDDPAAPRELVDLGFNRVSLAAVYHSVRALMPHHPSRAVITAPSAAAYLPMEDQRFAAAGTRLRPPPAAWLSHPDAFGRGCRALATHGLGCNAWVVGTHSSVLSSAHPDLALRNVFGDRYAHALCPAQPEVQRYVETLVGALGETLEPTPSNWRRAGTSVTSMDRTMTRSGCRSTRS